MLKLLKADFIKLLENTFNIVYYANSKKIIKQSRYKRLIIEHHSDLGFYSNCEIFDHDSNLSELLQSKFYINCDIVNRTKRLKRVRVCDIRERNRT
jgi:hypothetical protein